jgi:hypothetical protein
MTSEAHGAAPCESAAAVQTPRDFGAGEYGERGSRVGLDHTTNLLDKYHTAQEETLQKPETIAAA